MARALQQAKEARLRVLELMAAAIAEPRADLAPHAPRIQITQIDPERIGELIGPGGKVIRGLQEEFGVTINVEEDGTVQVATADGEAAEKALNAIADLFYEAQPGDEIHGKVTRVAPFGAFVSVKPGQDGLIHISDLASGLSPPGGGCGQRRGRDRRSRDEGGRAGARRPGACREV